MRIEITAYRHWTSDRVVPGGVMEAARVKTYADARGLAAGRRSTLWRADMVDQGQRAFVGRWREQTDHYQGANTDRYAKQAR